MAQYREGTVDVTNGSSTVVLSAGAAIANIPAGSWFILTDETVDGSGIVYSVAGTPTLDTQFELTAPWAGATATARVYAVHTDFSINGVPILSGDEAGLAAILNRAFQIFENATGVAAGSFPGLVGGFSFSGAGKQVAVVNAGETSLAPRDIRFIQRAHAEVAPTSISNRLVQYSGALGSLNSSAGRVTQWNDLSGSARHATQDSVGPRLVGEVGRAAYGLNFETTGAAGDDVMMIATVPASQNTMFLFYVGRVDQRHAGSQNLWKTAHAATIDTQTAGDIELAPASSGSTLNLRISTSTGLGQLVPLGTYKNGLPFVLALTLASGVITGWVQGQGEGTATEFTGSYNHGTGFNSDRVRLGLSPDFITAHVMHEFLLASSAPSASDLRGVVIWAQNRYFRSPLAQDEPDPRFTAPVWYTRQPILAAHRGMVVTDGATITALRGRSLTLGAATATASLDWSRATFLHTGDENAEFTLELPSTAEEGFELDIVQQGTTTGWVTITFETGAVNDNSFVQTVTAGQKLRVAVVRNSDGASAAYAGFITSGTGVGGGGGDVGPGDIGTVELADGSVTYVKIAAASKRTVTATPTLGIYVLDDSNSGRAFRAEEALEFEIANDVSKGSWWELIGRSSGVTAVIEGDAGNIVHNGANVDTVTLLNGYTAFLTVEANAGTAPNVAASGGFSGAIATPAGPVDFADNVVSRPELKDYAETSTSPTNSAGTVVLDLTLGNAFQHTLTANITTLTISNPPATGKVGTIVLKITQDSTPRTISWPGSVDWPGGVAPTLSTGSGDVDLFTFITWNAGTRWFGIPGGQDFS